MKASPWTLYSGSPSVQEWLLEQGLALQCQRAQRSFRVPKGRSGFQRFEAGAHSEQFTGR